MLISSLGVSVTYSNKGFRHYQQYGSLELVLGTIMAPFASLSPGLIAVIHAALSYEGLS